LTGFAQTTPPSEAEVRRLMAQPKVQGAFQHVDLHRDDILKEWAAITEVNAPSGEERERALYIERELRKMNLDDVHFDGAGNVVAVRKGTGGGPRIVIDAHMDTVFKAGLKIKATIRGGNIYAPGVGDDTRNIEAMLAMIRALNAAQIKTRGDLIFLFTVAEESDMGGAKFFTKANKGKVDHYVALDGGYEGFTYAGIGIFWYRIHFLGPGGHTRLPSPPNSAVLAMSRAIARIYQIRVPDSPQSFLNIGMVGGSEVVNAKASDAWFTLDLRSTNQPTIDDMKRQIDAIVRAEAARERLRVKEDIITQTPVANIPGHRNGYLVKTAESVFRAMGFNPPIGNSGSNNASAALNNGISAISTGSGPCSNPHALSEACAIEPIYKGIKKLILLGLTLAQFDDGTRPVVTPAPVRPATPPAPQPSPTPTTLPLPTPALPPAAPMPTPTD
jgi:acetylornithine deacetylase/succinyl-diaminopimelate desuccinylase-like protein